MYVCVEGSNLIFWQLAIQVARQNFIDQIELFTAQESIKVYKSEISRLTTVTINILLNN